MVRSKQIEQYKATLKLTRLQREVLVGILLGDAHLETSNQGRTYRLKIEQSARHQAYVEHLYGSFREWVLTGPRPASRIAEGRTPTTSYSFQTVSHSGFRFYAHQFYIAGKKQVPKQIQRWLTPRAMAYWFMDDGSMKSEQSKGVLFNTQGFSKSDVERLIEVLNSKFKLQASLRSQRDGCQIYVSGKCYEAFRDLVESFVITEMRYKLPPARRTRMPKK